MTAARGEGTGGQCGVGGYPDGRSPPPPPAPPPAARQAGLGPIKRTGNHRPCGSAWLSPRCSVSGSTEAPTNLSCVGLFIVCCPERKNRSEGAREKEGTESCGGAQALWVCVEALHTTAVSTVSAVSTMSEPAFTLPSADSWPLCSVARRIQAVRTRLSSATTA